MLLQSPSHCKSIISYNYQNANNNNYIITPQHMNALPSNCYFYNENNNDNNIYKDIYSKEIISDSIKAELKSSSSNYISLINTPTFEKICYKIFFPQIDPFYLSSNKKSPKKDINIEDIKSSLYNELNINFNNNNSSKNQNTKRKNNFSLKSSNSPKIKDINNFSFSFSKSRSKSKPKDNQTLYKNNKIKNNLNNNLIEPKLSIRKNRKYIRDIKALFPKENSNLNLNEQNILCSYSSSTKTNSIKEAKRKRNLLKTKIKSKKVYRYGSKRPKRYNILDEEIKKKLLQDAQTMKTIDVAKKYGISTRNINRWKKIGIKRKKGSGRKLRDPALEKKLLIWFNTQDKMKITSKLFKEKALELSNNINFRASSGWLTNMKKKYHIKFR